MKKTTVHRTLLTDWQTRSRRGRRERKATLSGAKLKAIIFCFLEYRFSWCSSRLCGELLFYTVSGQNISIKIHV
ncbi:MAG: hypothetical protein GY775_07225 [Candidatus Scalindua sp.]|nr:hypothetical protein [Candidatus Scalindua sp.]